jgi:hypothetical protein
MLLQSTPLVAHLEATPIAHEDGESTAELASGLLILPAHPSNHQRHRQQPEA